MNSRVADTVLPPVICAADPELPDPASPSVASFAFFERVTKPHPTKVVSIDELVRDIVGGRWAEPVRHIRACSAKADADRLKVRTLPSIKVSGQFRDRTAGSLIGHSGLLCLDFDFLGSHLAQF